MTMKKKNPLKTQLMNEWENGVITLKAIFFPQSSWLDSLSIYSNSFHVFIFS